MIPIAEMTPAQLAGFVGGHLGKKGIDVVLSGGSCVAIYSKGIYVSSDLDFVNTGFTSRKKLIAAMAEIGFEEESRYFRNPETEYRIEFISGPLGVGDEPVRQIREMNTATGSFKIISPTDCVKDRLAGYFHWDDLPCLEQAVLVAKANEIDINDIARWSAREGKGDEFKEIRSRLEEGD